MTDSRKGFILAGLDNSTLGESVSEFAIWISQCNQHPIKFLHVIEHSHKSENAHHEGTLTPGIRDQLLKELTEEERQESKQHFAEAKIILEAAHKRAEAGSINNFKTSKRHGTLPQTLADFESETALVVLGYKGKSHSEGQAGLGAQLKESIGAIHTPLFIAKKAFTEPKKLMFAYNGSDTSKKALQMLKNYRFVYENLEIHVVYVHSGQTAAETLLAKAKSVFQEAGMTIQTKALAGEPLEELTRYQKENDIDITAMGAFGHGKVHHFFFGSFTQQMLLKSDTHFLIVR